MSVPIAALVFALLIIAFGVVPSEFIVWFNKQYNNINMRRFVRDPIVIVYHLAAIGAFATYAVMYQKRQVKRAETAAVEVEAGASPESAYGRPMAKAGK